MVLNTPFYVNFQSEKLERELGIYRQLSGGCYYISFEQIMNIQPFASQIQEVCCIISLTEVNIFMSDEAFPLRSLFRHLKLKTLKYFTLVIWLSCFHKKSFVNYLL